MNRQLIRSYILLVAVAILLFTVPVAFTLTKQLRDDTELSVLREARTMALLLGNGDRISCDALEKVAKAYGVQTPGDVEVTPTASCAPDLPEPAGNAALSRAVEKNDPTTDWGSDVIWGKHLEITVPAQGQAAVRIVYSTSGMTDRLWQIWGFRAGLAVFVLAAAAAIGAFAARRITAPLRELNSMASKFSDGDLTARSPVTGPPETQTLARTLNQGAERLDTLIASQRIFVADASHQLRTPLTALRLSLDNIADGVDDEFVREDVEQATAEVVRMSRLVNGLLVLARAEAKVAAAEPLALRDIVRERMSVWRPAADERGVTITLGGSADGRPSVLATPGHLDQVLDNVLSNALEVSPDGGTITVRGETAGDEVVLSVLDEGPGMSHAEKSRAFDRFWRGQGLTGRSGSGLGLAVVKQLVTDDGGTVALRDAPGGGLCVEIRLRAAAQRTGG
ncbi:MULTISPECIES: HAMP domain-containing sensor histidine kinase [unclassified Streptomyces]|uniref:HAMP domain-containing sensor histidine kinase n=1 Tax=unclassified Streptomyces TaxID=2593676 RepID=UPI002258150E|nr:MULTISPECIES: HAMP domain-containing sensor histidine kinase [unclassified Streptomyces]MCX4882438.1 HAMP domain-containing histidine kinase [Streptomyces sp. NBC_00847]MCX5422467.1 HAMP domain-containing histidine kinase [Streptomyces sp. NBC_00078]